MSVWIPRLRPLLGRDDDAARVKIEPDGEFIWLPPPPLPPLLYPSNPVSETVRTRAIAGAIPGVPLPGDATPCPITKRFSGFDESESGLVVTAERLRGRAPLPASPPPPPPALPKKEK